MGYGDERGRVWTEEGPIPVVAGAKTRLRCINFVSKTGLISVSSWVLEYSGMSEYARITDSPALRNHN